MTLINICHKQYKELQQRVNTVSIILEATISSAQLWKKLQQANLIIGKNLFPLSKFLLKIESSSSKIRSRIHKAPKVLLAHGLRRSPSLYWLDLHVLKWTVVSQVCVCVYIHISGDASDSSSWDLARMLHASSVWAGCFETSCVYPHIPGGRGGGGWDGRAVSKEKRTDPRMDTVRILSSPGLTTWRNPVEVEAYRMCCLSFLCLCCLYCIMTYVPGFEPRDAPYRAGALLVQPPIPLT